MELWLALLIYLALGAIIGWIAAKIMESRTGLIMDIIVGIVGSMLGGFLARQLGISGGLVVEFLVAVGGAVLLLLIIRLIRRA